MNVKKIRQELGVTQREFAKIAGVSLCTVRNWEQGYNKPNLESERKINIILKLKRR